MRDGSERSLIGLPFQVVGVGVRANLSVEHEAHQPSMVGLPTGDRLHKVLA